MSKQLPVKTRKNRYNKDVPVLYQLYSEYYSRIWQKERKLQESLESVKVGGGKEERRKEEEVSREEGISNVLGDTPKGQGEDDTILRIAQDVGRLNLTEFVKEYEEEQGKERVEERVEERIVDQRKETQEMVEKLSMREAGEVEQSKCKSKTDSNKRQERKAETPKHLQLKLQKHNSNKDPKSSSSLPKCQKKIQEHLLVNDQTRTQPPSNQKTIESPSFTPKSENNYPTKTPKNQSLCSQSDLEDLRSKYQASERVATKMKEENQIMRREMEEMKRVQMQLMEMLSKQGNKN